MGSRTIQGKGRWNAWQEPRWSCLKQNRPDPSPLRLAADPARTIRALAHGAWRAIVVVAGTWPQIPPRDAAWRKHPCGFPNSPGGARRSSHAARKPRPRLFGPPAPVAARARSHKRSANGRRGNDVPLTGPLTASPPKRDWRDAPSGRPQRWASSLRMALWIARHDRVLEAIEWDGYRAKRMGAISAMSAHCQHRGHPTTRRHRSHTATLLVYRRDHEAMPTQLIYRGPLGGRACDHTT